MSPLILLFWSLVSPALGASPCPDASPRCKIDAALDAYRRRGVISGTLLVHRRDRDLDWEMGRADFRSNLANSRDTRFLIASCSKSYAAAAILKLAEEGKLRLDDKASAFVPEYEPAARFTILQLLHHVTGVPEAYETDTIESRIDRKPLALTDFLAAIKGQPLAFTPGTRYAYSNTGYLLLGEIARRASGENYSSYLRRKFFEPLGLRATTVGPPTDATPARSFQMRGKRHIDVRDREKLGPIAASDLFADTNIYTSAKDLSVWTEKMTSGAILSPASTAAMLTPTLNEYGEGWIIFRDDKGRMAYEHAGSYRSYQSWMRRYPDEEIVVTWLGNQELGSRDLAAMVDAVSEAALTADWSRP